MRSILQQSRRTIGMAPGSLVADPSALEPKIHLIAYGPDTITELEDCSLDEALAARDTNPVVWIDVTGLGDVDVVTRIGEAFGLHRLSLEDILNAHQRPKIEDYEDHIFVVLRMLVAGREPATEQVSMFVGNGFVVSFQERPGDCLHRVRERLRRGGSRTRRAGADYLAYSLIDAVVDGYFPVLEAYGEEIESLEDAMIGSSRRADIARLHTVKRDLLFLRRSVWPTRDLVNSMIRDESSIVGEQTRLFLRDAYDHTIQIMDLVETYREIIAGLVDVYLSSQSARMNEIMKVLTIVATIFIPLSFLASLWGMNFDTSSPWNMPELGWRFGYPAALGLMAVVAGLLLWYFRRAGWLAAEMREPAEEDRERPPDR